MTTFSESTDWMEKDEVAYLTTQRMTDEPCGFE